MLSLEFKQLALVLEICEQWHPQSVNKLRNVFGRSEIRAKKLVLLSFQTDLDVRQVASVWLTDFAVFRGLTVDLKYVTADLVLRGLQIALRAARVICVVVKEYHGILIGDVRASLVTVQVK